LRRLRTNRQEYGSTPIDANKAVSRRLAEEVFSAGRFELVGELVSDKYAGRDPAIPEPIAGPEGLRQQVMGYRSAFPDLTLTVVDQIAEDDRVVTRWTARGTHEGELFGLGPTGKQATVSGTTIDRIVDGRIVESWVNWDSLGLLQQLGAVPEPIRA
jgi:steroid delta-isomerase-like uncharacterized protein